MKKLNVGAIPFLNTKPIVFGLESGLGADRLSLQFHSPAHCARLLEAEKIDLGLIPSIEYARADDLWIVPGIAVASRGAAASVLLYSGKSVENVKTIAVDSRSRTSVALLQILCAEHYGIEPELEAMEPDLGPMLKHCDAALMIGDHALYCREKTAVRRDLGADWRELTGQPFVFAFWAGKSGALSTEETGLLQLSLKQGLENITKISSNYPAPGINNAAELHEHYLSENIQYRLGEEELTGLKLFYIKAWEHNLIDGVPRLRFYEG